MLCASAPAPAQGASSAPAAASASVPDDLQPLLRSIQETVDAVIASKEGERLFIEFKALRIPEYQTWFPATFGPDNGAKLASIYSEMSEKTESRVIEYFVLHAPRGGQITATLASGGSVPQKTEVLQQFDDAIRRALQQPSFFSHVHALPEMPTTRLRVGGNVVAAKVVSRVTPVYPTEARMQHISGTVRMHAIIAKDGSIKHLEVISGHPTLVDAALEAVRQWRYQPTMLEGQPFEIDTTIDVIFALN